MTSASELAGYLARVSEDRSLEFKEAKNQYDTTKLFKRCVAIANENGGKIILGVSDAHPRQVVGTAAFANVAKIEAEIFHKLKFRVQVEEMHYEARRVVIFHIPPRPNGQVYHYEGAYLMRVGEETRPMSQERLAEIFAEGKPDWLEEATISGLDDQQVVDLLDTQSFFELFELPYPSNRDGVIDRLVGERLVNRTPEGLAIRRIGVLLLAKNLGGFKELARKAPRVVVYSGPSKLDTKLDRTGSKGYAVGFQGLVRFVMEQLPQNELIRDALRTEVKLLPEVVIRELVANALVHQDVSISGTSVMIEIYSNRLEISNPGEPLVPVERFIDGYRSRNERLADLLRRMHICEEKSSGIDRVVAAAETLQLPAPDFRAGYERTEVVVFGPKAFDSMDRDERVRACYQHCVLKWVLRDKMTNQSLRQRFALPDSKSATASQVIGATIESGLIKAASDGGGSKKFAKYIPHWA